MKLNAKLVGLLLCSSSLLFSAVSCSGGSGEVLAIVHFDQTILGETQKELGVSIGIKKGNTELKEALNTALATVSSEQRNTWMSEALVRSTAESIESEGDIITTAPYDESKPTLTIGLECDYSPFNWTATQASSYSYPIKGTSNSYADGYDITMARYLANYLNYNLVVVKLGWETLIPSLDSGVINAVIAGMTDTEERRMSIDFTNEYYRSEMVLVVRANSQYASATSLSEFSGAKFVSQKETVTDSVIETWVSEYNVKHLQALSSFSVCASAVVSGTADVMTAELPVANAIVNGANR